MEMMIPKKRVSSGNWLHLRLELGFYLQPDFSMPNAAPELQAMGLGWRSKGMEAACPLEGLVRLLIQHVHIDSLNSFSRLRLWC
jgi:hypothetical protein